MIVMETTRQNSFKTKTNSTTKLTVKKIPKEMNIIVIPEGIYKRLKKKKRNSNIQVQVQKLNVEKLNIDYGGG